MRMSSGLTKWTIVGLAAILTVTAGIALQSVRAPARAQLSGVAGLTPEQLMRLQRIQGQFVYESGPARPELWKAIELGTPRLDPAQARRTRAQLEQLLGPPPHLELVLDTGASGGPSLAVQEGRAKASAPVTGQVRALLPKGARADAQPLQISHQLQGTTLLRVVEGGGFRQERRFSPNANGATLTLEIRVSGAALATPLKTTALYRRL